MRSSIFLLKELKGSKVNVKFDKEEYKDAIYLDFDMQGKFIYLRIPDPVEGDILKIIWWPGTKGFQMDFKDLDLDEIMYADSLPPLYE